MQSKSKSKMMENKEQKTFEPQSASGVAEKYAEILLQVKGLMEGVDNPVGVLANVAALLKEAFDYYFWVGFYVVRHGELQLGYARHELILMGASP